MNTTDAKATIAPGNAASKVALFSTMPVTTQYDMVKGPEKVLIDQCPTCSAFAKLLTYTNALTGASTNNCQKCIAGFKLLQEKADHVLAVATEEAMKSQAKIAVPKPVHVVVQPVVQLAGCMLCPHTATVFPEVGISLCERCAADQQGGM